MLKKSKIIRPTLFIILLSLVLGVSLGFVQDMSREQIEINYNYDVQKSILYTIGIETDQLSKEDVNGLFKMKMKESRIRGLNYYEYIETGEVIGYCFPFSGKGLWGNILGYISVDKKAESIIGLVFTSHNETPGLGGRIDELWFKEQFRGLDIRAESGFVEFDSGEETGLEAIAGATMTSDSVQKVLNDSIRELKRIIMEDLNE